MLGRLQGLILPARRFNNRELFLKSPQQSIVTLLARKTPERKFGVNETKLEQARRCSEAETVPSYSGHKRTTSAPGPPSCFHHEAQLLLLHRRGNRVTFPYRSKAAL